jgi:outer membrane immunogenic protein
MTTKSSAYRTLTCLFIVFCACNALASIALAGSDLVPTSKEMKEVAPAPSCDVTWTGFYIGLNVGYGTGNPGDTEFDPVPNAASFVALQKSIVNTDPRGVIGGGQIGYNYQWNWLVLGAEADFQGSDVGGTRRDSPVLDNIGNPVDGSFLRANEHTDWFGTVRGRIGWKTFCHLLVYVTGGLAYGQVDFAADTNYTLIGGPDYSTSFEKTKVGYTVGGGLEYALNQRWSIKAEYLYYNLGDEIRNAKPVPPNPPFQVRNEWDTTANTLRCGLNFHF